MSPRRRLARSLATACLLMPAGLGLPGGRPDPTAAAETTTAAAPETAAADAWPLARGCPAGTGRTRATLRLPLREAWHRDFGTTAFGAVPVIAGDTIYLGDLDGTFHALALADGSPRWSFRAEGAGFPSAAAVSPDPALPLVVVGDDTGLVRGFDRGSGRVVWEYPTDGEISGGPTIVPTAAGPRVLVGSQDASLSCLALADGTPLWKHAIADQIRCTPTVARTPAGDRCFIAGCDGRLHVIDVATGAETAAVPIDGPTGATPAVLGERVFFGTEGGVFLAIDFTAATVAWRSQAVTPGQAYRASAALADGLAIVGSRGKAVEAFATADGRRVWRQPLRGRVDASPVVVEMADAEAGSGPGVIVADAAGRISLLDAATGTPRFEFEAGGRFDGGAAVAGGRIVVAAHTGTVWCFADAEH